MTFSVIYSIIFILEIFTKIAELSAQYLVAVDNFLIRKVSKMELFVVCRKLGEFIPLEAIEVEEYLDNGKVKFKCPLCDAYHESKVIEKA